MKHKPDIHLHFREGGYKGSFFQWETEAGHAVSFSQSNGVNAAHIFYICLHCVEVSHCLGNLNFLLISHPQNARHRLRQLIG